MKFISGFAAIAVLALAAQSLSAAPPYDGYTNPSWLYDPSPYGFWITRVKIVQGASTLLDNASANTPGYAGTPRCHTFYSGVTPANMVPSAQHQLQVTVAGGNYTMGVAAWIDYNNDGDFLDANEAIGTSGPVSQGTGVTLNINFVPPASSGVLRMRVRAAYSQIPNHSTNQFSYGESEDYLVNMGFAISTTSPLPSGADQTPYGPVDIVATNGTAPYTWQYSAQGYIKSGSLPAGLTAAPTGSPAMLRITGTPTTPGTSVFTVEVWDNAGKTSEKQFSITVFPQPAALPWSDDFSTDKGWLLSGPWQRAAAQAFSQATPPQSQPGTDHTAATSDNMILGDTIGTPYKYTANDSNTHWAVSPPFSGAGKSYVRLRFWGWLGLAIGSTAKIEATNNGSTWVSIWASTSGVTYGGNATATWTSYYYDLSAVCANQSVCQIRIGIGPTAADQSTGWSIDDLLIEEPTSDLKVQETGAGGVQISDNQTVGSGRDFGQVAVNTQSAPLTIYMTNLGPTNITFNPAISKTGAQPTDFYLNASALMNPLPPGQSTSFTITFYRTSAGVSTATFNVFHNAAFSGTSPFEINVRGEAIVPQPIIRVNQTTAGGTQITHNQSPAGTVRDFGSQDINAGPTAQITIFVTNSGTGTLAISTPDMGGTWWTEYVIDSTGMASQLTAGQSTSFKVAFDPSSQGQKDAIVRVAHTDGTQPSPFYIPVTGNGTSASGPVLVVHEGPVSGPVIAHADPASGARDFGNVLVGSTSPPTTITIQNNGGAAMTVGIPVLGGTNPGEFSLNTTGFQTSLNPGADTSFEVSFAPTSVGVKLAQVTFTHNDTTATSPFIVNFRGNGVTTAPAMEVRETDSTGALLANPAPATGILDFGTQDVNAGPTAAAVIYIENTGTATLTLGIPSFNPSATEFQIQTAGMATSLAPGANTSFSITFDPTTTGTHTAVIQFTHNDGQVGSPSILNLTGDAIRNAPLLEVREGTTIGPVLASGDTAIGSTVRDLGSVDVSAGNTFPGIIAILNNGTQTLVLGTPVISGVNSADFTLNLANFTANVAPGASTQFDVLFDPVLAGMKDCQVEFTHNDPGNTSPFIVRFIGTGTDPNAVQITTPDLPAGSPDVQYGPMAMAAIQGSTPYVWSVYYGNLPPGLSMSPGGVISGTPTGFGGNYQVIIRVTDQTGATNEKTYTVVVSSALGARKAESGCAAGDSGSSTVLLLLTLLGFLALGVRTIRSRA